MKTQEFVNYEAPLVEIIEVEVERGFAASPGLDELTNQDWTAGTNP